MKSLTCAGDMFDQAGITKDEANRRKAIKSQLLQSTAIDLHRDVKVSHLYFDYRRTMADVVVVPGWGANVAAEIAERQIGVAHVLALDGKKGVEFNPPKCEDNIHGAIERMLLLLGVLNAPIALPSIDCSSLCAPQR